MSALNFFLIFLNTKMFYSLEPILTMPGEALFSSTVILFGLILMYNILPETENRTLEEIEIHFADDSKTLTDRKVAKLLPKVDLANVSVY